MLKAPALTAGQFPSRHARRGLSWMAVSPEARMGQWDGDKDHQFLECGPNNTMRSAAYLIKSV